MCPENAIPQPTVVRIDISHPHVGSETRRQQWLCDPERSGDGGPVSASNGPVFVSREIADEIRQLTDVQLLHEEPRRSTTVVSQMRRW